MKKRIRQILVSATWLSVSILAMGWFFSPPALAQRIKPKIINVPQPPKPKSKSVVWMPPEDIKGNPPAKHKQQGKSEVGWKLIVNLIVKGSGEAARDSGGSDSWSIDRQYTGTFWLGFPVRVPKFYQGMTQREVLAAMKSAPVTWFNTEMGLGSFTRTILVKIKDKWIKRVLKVGSDELITTTTTWEGEGNALILTGQSLSFRNDKLGFNVRIPLGLHGTDELLTIVSDVGGSTVTLQEPLAYIPIPSVKGVIDVGVIHHPSDLALIQQDSGKYFYEAGPFDLDHAAIWQLPQSQKGVRVTVRYLFSPIGKQD